MWNVRWWLWRTWRRRDVHLSESRQRFHGYMRMTLSAEYWRHDNIWSLSRERAAGPGGFGVTVCAEEQRCWTQSSTITNTVSSEASGICWRTRSVALRISSLCWLKVKRIFTFYSRFGWKVLIIAGIRVKRWQEVKETDSTVGRVGSGRPPDPWAAGSPIKVHSPP